MTLSDLASVASLVSGIAVLISLIYLNVQVSQAKRNQQSSIRDSRATRIVDIYMRSTDASLADAITKCQRGDEDITETQFRQFLQFMIARLIHTEEAFSQFQDGLMPQDAFDQLGKGLVPHFSAPGSRAIYSRLRGAFSAEFLTYLDEIIASTPVIPDRFFASFKSDLAAEKAKTNA